MTEQEERARLLALAHLKNEVEPADIEQLTGVSHAACLKLRRELREAEAENTVDDLFGISNDAIEILVKSVLNHQVPMIEPYPIAEVIKDVDTITRIKSSEELLKEDTYKATRALINKIQTVAAISTNVDTIVGLAEALAKLNDSFFPHDKTASGQSTLESFERFLSD